MGRAHGQAARRGAAAVRVWLLRMRGLMLLCVVLLVCLFFVCMQLRKKWWCQTLESKSPRPSRPANPASLTT
jgi:hypothetical protein